MMGAQKKICGILTQNKEVKNAAWIIICRIARMVIGLLLSIITARFLGPSNFGLINYGSAYVAFFTALCTLGLHSVIVKDFVDNGEKQGEILGTAVLLRVVASMLSVALITTIASIVDAGEKQTILVVICCSFGLVFQAFDTFNYWFQSRYESKVSSLASLVAYVVTSIYKIVLLISRKSVVWFACSTAVDYICIAVLLYIVYKRENGPSMTFSLKRAKFMLGRSYHYILAGMMSVIYGQTDKIMLKHMLDESSVGIYSLATSLCSLWTFVLAAIIESLYPTIIQLHANDNYANFEKKNRQLYAIVIYVSTFVGLMILLFGEWAIALLYGQEYIGAAAPLKVVAWYTIFSYLGVARNAWIVCENKQRYLKYMYFGAAVLNILLNLLMIPTWGAVGAAAASLITQVFTSIVIPYMIPAMRPNAKLMTEAFMLRKIR